MTDAKPDPKPDPKPVETLSFEEAMRELEQVVDRLESGDAPLDASIALYERGAKLKAHCEARLKAAELKVAQIAEAPDGSVSARAVQVD
ncbi:MAG: exodeoxyribonuclease VII small subunit [Albimonas sp.]|uniref:exodeoxyribonuclease VII small subunit n=1 Tax=Albimonas sp. TaxID=1872425 RepID=UPI0040565DF4|tara:strand:- start:575 stop:841 length:267 start_codon:yes stop_codon:yes gene_type:complete